MKVLLNDLKKHHKPIKNKLKNIFDYVIENSSFIGGNEVKNFEDNFAKINNSKYCISCGNGTDALFIALKCLNLKKTDEVITTSHSWISTSEVVSLAGGNVVFCDTKEDDYNIDENKIEKLINKNTVGIIAVHLHGNPCKMEKINILAKKKRLWVLEDCAQSHLAKIKNKNVGNFGVAGTFSFFPGKNLGALGDGGCIVTNDKKLASKMRAFANHGGKGKHIIEGINSRLDTLQAMALNVKLRYLKNWTEKRIKAAKYYNRCLKELKNIKLPQTDNSKKHVYHQYVIKTNKRDELRKFLTYNGIQSGIHYDKILPILPAYKYKKLNKKKYKNSLHNQSTILSLPIYPEITKKELNYVIKKIKEFFQ